jgi:uncharacterized protein Yka (UPF0111/DUF47 family)|tara:strand:+ start:25 stop:417 length:393 start_codon:yes stop_codon:yes gene_type:complete
METTVIAALFGFIGLGALILGVVNYISLNKQKQELQLQFQQLDFDKFKDIDEVFKNIKDLNSKIDSRIDKLNHKFETEFNYLSREIVDSKKNTENDIRSMLTNWQSSDEFKMVLNSIKKKEMDSDKGITY